MEATTTPTAAQQDDTCEYAPGNAGHDYTGVDDRCMWCDRRRPGALRALMAIYEANRAFRESLR